LLAAFPLRSQRLFTKANPFAINLPLLAVLSAPSPLPPLLVLGLVLSLVLNTPTPLDAPVCPTTGLQTPPIPAGTCTAYFYNDPNIVYEIQADGSMAQTTIGNEYTFTNVTSGSTTTGLSACTLGSATGAGAGNQGQMRVVDLAPYVDNAWGDSYTIVRVVNSQSQFFGSVTAIA
jgi:hypothetical protein